MYDDSTTVIRPRARPEPELMEASLRPQARPDVNLMVAGPTPENVAEQALEPTTIPLDELALVGIFSKPDGAMALVREADGNIRSIQQGDVTGRLTVVALNDDGVRLSDGNGAPHILTMPS